MNQEIVVTTLSVKDVKNFIDLFLELEISNLFKAIITTRPKLEIELEPIVDEKIAIDFLKASLENGMLSVDWRDKIIIRNSFGTSWLSDA